VRTAWHIVEPHTVYQHNWHIDDICLHLEAVTDGRIENLVIMVPPGHMKSLIVNVFWPAWVWGTKPHKRWIFGAHSQSLSTRDSIRMRDLIRSDEYKQIFQVSWSLRDDQDQKTRYDNTATGFRLATSVGGAGTGERADFIVADDPIKAQDAQSELKREDVSIWWGQAMSTRDNVPGQTRRVIIMQRLHDKDLAGEYETKGYTVLRLPAEFIPSKRCSTPIGWSDPRTKEGELLFPTRFTPEVQAKLRRDLGSFGYSAQQQQDPAPADGGIIKAQWWKLLRKFPSDIREIVQFVDCAQKPGLSNDFTVIATWARVTNGYVVLDVWRGKTDAVILEATVKAQADKWRPNAIVIEDKSAGSSLIQTLRYETDLPVIAYEPHGSKEVRAIAGVPTIEAGKVSLFVGAPWSRQNVHVNSEWANTNIEDGFEHSPDAFIQEHSKFPKGANDDYVDTTTMAIDYFRKSDGAYAGVTFL